MKFALPEKLVFTAREAAEFLGLFGDDRDEQSALRTLKRLVDEKKTLRAMRYAKHRCFHLADLQDFLQRQRGVE